MTTRDEIRAKILATHNKASKIISFFGADIELKQLSMAQVLDTEELPEGEDAAKAKTNFLIRQITKCAYVPGTDELVFEEADAAQLVQLPFNGDVNKAVEALKELAEVNFQDKKDGSSEIPPGLEPIKSPTS